MVTERLTSRQQNATTSITLHKHDYKLEFIKGSDAFKPGLPYQFTIKVARQDDVPVSDPNPAALQVKYGYSYNHDEYETMTYSVPPNGLVTVILRPPSNDSIVILGLEATYKDLTEWFPTVQRALSKSNTYIEVSLNTDDPKVCEVPVKILMIKLRK